jgi:RNA polymerase sigma-70 factor (ECF subfamily)
MTGLLSQSSSRRYLVVHRATGSICLHRRRHPDWWRVIEPDLTERCRQGDRDAMREVYDRTSDRIYRLLVRMTGNESDAFDLAQETYLRAFTRIGAFEGQSSLDTWLYRIAVNEALQFMRRAAKERARLEDVAPATSTQSEQDDVAGRLDVEGALAALDPTDRTMLLLRYQEGLDYRAIAEVTGCAVGTVGSRLNRARVRMRELLKDTYPAAEESPRPKHPTGRKESVRTARPKAEVDPEG